ncbi:hypothetical protein [Antribacter gilvus]|uniref:hypothetical protein n=1 Tax=Antribacter gilvus TaxID=2304675 RepID=UPI000F7B261F|nr:hypothetical protein [Antribacter gilvus]
MSAPTDRTAVEALRARADDVHKRAVKAVENTVAGAVIVVGLWFWLILLLVAAVLVVIELRTGSIGPGSVVENILVSPRWFALVMGLIVPVGVLTVHLAAGGTRKALVDGIVRAALFSGGAYGVATAALLLLERLAFFLADREWFRGDGSADARGFSISILSEGLSIATYLLVGVAIGIGYYRYGGWLGTVLIPLFLIPCAVADAFRLERLRDLVEPFPGPLGPLSLLLLGIGGVLLAILAAERLLRDVPVRPSR